MEARETCLDVAREVIPAGGCNLDAVTTRAPREAGKEAAELRVHQWRQVALHDLPQKRLGNLLWRRPSI